jgi:hypothetical protein
MAAELCQPSLKSAKVVMVVYEFFETNVMYEVLTWV